MNAYEIRRNRLYDWMAGESVAMLMLEDAEGRRDPADGKRVHGARAGADETAHAGDQSSPPTFAPRGRRIPQS